MIPLAIYGAGGFGREVACLINHINQTDGHTWDLIGFFDDGKPVGFSTEYGKVLGNIEALNNWTTPLSVVLAFGDPKALKIVSSKINNPLIDFPNIIAPDTFFLDPYNYKIGKGNIICPMCFISCNVSIGDFNVFNWRISIGHDVSIGNCNAFMPGGKVSGEVVIGNCNLFGADAFLKQQLKMGDNITVSPLSALLTKPKDNSLYVGNPAKMIKF